jgi:hypothetical protein
MSGESTVKSPILSIYSTQIPTQFWNVMCAYIYTRSGRMRLDLSRKECF